MDLGSWTAKTGKKRLEMNVLVFKERWRYTTESHFILVRTRIRTSMGTWSSSRMQLLLTSAHPMKLWMQTAAELNWATYIYSTYCICPLWWNGVKPTLAHWRVMAWLSLKEKPVSRSDPEVPANLHSNPHFLTTWDPPQLQHVATSNSAVNRSNSAILQILQSSCLNLKMKLNWPGIWVELYSTVAYPD